jgi:hypothetical protein
MSYLPPTWDGVASHLMCAPWHPPSLHYCKTLIRLLTNSSPPRRLLILLLCIPLSSSAISTSTGQKHPKQEGPTTYLCVYRWPNLVGMERPFVHKSWASCDICWVSNISVLCCYKDKRQERATGIGYEVEEGEEDLSRVQQEAASEDNDHFPATSKNWVLSSHPSFSSR